MLAATSRRVAPPSIQEFHLPAPTGGLNRIDAGGRMPESDCILCYNMLASAYGLRSRTGYQEWCTGLTGAADNEVRSVLPFTGSQLTTSKLFATTSSGIWDVSASSTTPTQVLAFGTTTGLAGYGVCHVVVTAAGHFLLYCDEVNGLCVYTESTTTWAAVTMGGGATQISGVNPTNLVFVNVFKNRVWLVERNSARAWYLAAGAIYGAAVQFDFGTKFRAGGHLAGLWNCTYDGGGGMDDSLVGVSAGGDVVIYQGTDPASASTFGLKGCWSVGSVLAGRRIATDYGGDLLVLSRSQGGVPLSKLVVGAASSQYATAKIAPLFNEIASSRATLSGWSVHVHPTDNALLVLYPAFDGEAREQLAMGLTTGAWSQYRDLPALSGGAWERDFFFGTADGRVCRNYDYLDGVTLADPNSYTAINWSVLTAYSSLGTTRAKQLQTARPILLSGQTNPLVQCTARYDYSLVEPTAPSGDGTSPGGWGSGLWGVALWGAAPASSAVQGLAGMGRHVALAIRGKAVSQTTLVGVDVAFTTGGLL